MVIEPLTPRLAWREADPAIAFSACLISAAYPSPCSVSSMRVPTRLKIWKPSSRSSKRS